MKVVLLRMGFGLLPGLTNPVRHWSNVTWKVPGRPNTSWTDARRHELARCGCSKQKYRPRACCTLQRVIAKLSRASASANLRAFSSSDILCKLNRACNGEYMVQGGESIINSGSSSITTLKHSALDSMVKKSYPLVRSKLQSAFNPSRLTAKATRGGEKTSMKSCFWANITTSWSASPSESTMVTLLEGNGWPSGFTMVTLPDGNGWPNCATTTGSSPSESVARNCRGAPAMALVKSSPADVLENGKRLLTKKHVRKCGLSQTIPESKALKTSSRLCKKKSNKHLCCQWGISEPDCFRIFLPF